MTLLCTAVPAVGQTGIGLDAAVANKHVWRGQTYTSGWVARPSVFIYHRWTSVVVTGGVTLHVEPFGLDQSQDVGYGRTWAGEVSVWTDVGLRLGPFLVNGGWTGFYPHLERAFGPAAERYGTHELYFKARMPRPRLTPLVSLAYDIDAVRGTFVEAGLLYRAPLWTQMVIPVGSLFLSAHAGLSLGQEVNETRTGESAYFKDRGLAYVAFSALSTVGYFPIGGLQSAVNLAFRVQINADPFLEDVSRRVDASHRTKLWFGLTWSFLGPRCRPEKRICRASLGT